MNRLLLSLISLGLATTLQAEPSRPNVILIFVDDLGYGDVGFNGAVGPKTPQLDRLYADSVRLTDAQSRNEAWTFVSDRVRGLVKDESNRYYQIPLAPELRGFVTVEALLDNRETLGRWTFYRAPEPETEPGQKPAGAAIAAGNARDAVFRGVGGR